jgi:hypothetical protein
MTKRRLPTPAIVGSADLAGIRDLQTAISAALEDGPIDENLLRREVWTYVRLQCQTGTVPAHVVMLLTELIEAATLAPTVDRQVLSRLVIRSCVEAYFGRLGSGAFGTGLEPHVEVPVLSSR